MVYFVVGHKLVKIGFAVDAQRRLAELQRFCPCKLKMVALIADGTEADERRVHRELKEWRSHGEWFKLTGDPVLAMIDAHKLPKPIVAFDPYRPGSKRKIRLSDAERQRRSDDMKRKLKAGVVGGQYGKLGGRPRKKKAALTTS